MRYILPTILSLSLMAAACSSKSGDTSDSASLSAPFTRLDRLVEQFPSMTAQRQHVVVDSLAIPLNDYIYLMGASTGDIPASIDSLSHTAAFAMFGPEIEEVFPDNGLIEKELGIIDANIASKLPGLPHYSYYGIISPYRQQIMLVDSVVYVALNHYLGEDHEAYSSMPRYVRATKKADYISLDIAEAIISVEYPFERGNAPTVTQYLIYQGALARAVATLTGTEDVAKLMGWTAGELEEVTSQETAVWRKMAADNLIYSTDMSIARRLSEPSLSSTLISPNLPGRVGRYIGYRIVDAYIANNPGTKLSDILSPDFYNSPSVLINSGYAP